MAGADARCVQSSRFGSCPVQGCTGGVSGPFAQLPAVLQEVGQLDLNLNVCSNLLDGISSGL